jgi:hypothetical protein
MVGVAIPRLPNAPSAYSQMQVNQLIRLIQTSIDELQRRGISYDIQATVGAAGSATALPANPEGYANVVIDGKEFVIPYYKPG